MTSPPSTVTATPSSVVLALWNGVPVLNTIPRLRNARSSALEDASSSSGDQPRQRLDDGHLGAEAAPDAGELAADHPAAEHDHRGRHPVEPECLLGGEDPLAVDVEAGQGLGVGAAGQDDVLAGVRASSVRRYLPRAGEPASALDHGDAAALDQAGQPLEQPLDDAVLVGVHTRHVDAVEGGPHPELRGLTRVVGDLGGVQQRLGRDAADVQAGAAEISLLDQTDLEARAGRPARHRSSHPTRLRG